MKKILRFIRLFLIIIGIFGLIIYISTKISWNLLYSDLNKSIKNEMDLIQLPNELKEESVVNNNWGCDYDWKRGGVRCKSFHTRYFISEKDPLEEFKELSVYLSERGWVCNHPFFGDKESYERNKDERYKPVCVFRKDSEFYLQLFLVFLGEKDTATYLDSEGKVKSILDRYSNRYPSIFKISIQAELKG